MDKIKYILTSWMEQEIPAVHTREYDYTQLTLNKIISFIGVRRSGKTSKLFEIMRHLLEENIDRNNLIYINFEDDRLYPLEGNELDSLIPIIKEIIPYNTKQPLYLFLDEIQNMPHWSKWLRRIQDTQKNIKLFVTGSSAKLLSKEIATELAGRTISNEIFPFSFKEYLKIKNFTYNLKNLEFSSHKPLLLKYLQQYIENGGFPELVLGDMDRNTLLQSYFDSIYYKDLISRYNIKSTKMFEDFLKLLLQNTSNIISLSKLEKVLKSVGHKVSKSTLAEYLQYAKEVYLCFPLQVFSYKIKDQLTYPKKIFSIDNGLLNAITVKFTENKGALLENLVFLHLRQLQKEIYYYITKNGREIDFVLKEDLKFTSVIQVCWSLKDSETKKREVRDLVESLKELGLSEGLILTRNEEDSFEVDGKKIIVKPIWKWLLE